MKKILLVGALALGFTACGSSDDGGSGGNNVYKAAAVMVAYFDVLGNVEASASNLELLNFVKKTVNKKGTFSIKAFTDVDCLDIIADAEAGTATYTFTNCEYEVADSLLGLLTQECSISETTQTVNGTLDVNEDLGTLSGTLTFTGVIDVSSCSINLTEDTGTFCGYSMDEIEAAEGSDAEFCAAL